MRSVMRDVLLAPETISIGDVRTGDANSLYSSDSILHHALLLIIPSPTHPSSSASYEPYLVRVKVNGLLGHQSPAEAPCTRLFCRLETLPEAPRIVGKVPRRIKLWDKRISGLVLCMMSACNPTRSSDCLVASPALGVFFFKWMYVRTMK